MAELSGVGLFVLATSTVAVATVTTVAVLWQPLRPLLAELCGGRRLGDAWATLISVCALLGATAASTLPDDALRDTTGRDALLGAAAQGALGLVGVLFSLFVTGGALFAYIRRTNACDIGRPQGPPAAVTSSEQQ